MTRALVIAALLCATLSAQQPTPRHRPKRAALVMIGSYALLMAGTYMDARSSRAALGQVGPHGYPLRENNNWYASGADHGFHRKGWLMMFGLDAALGAVEFVAYKKSPDFGMAFGSTLNTLWGTEHMIAARGNYKLIDGGRVWRLNNAPR